MEYDKNSFLAGLAVGRTLKGYAGGGGGGGGSTSSDCKIYDIAEVYGTGDTAVYTAPADGTLFYFGSLRDNSKLPAGMEIQVAKQFSYERTADYGGFVMVYQAVIAAKKTVSAGEELRFSLKGISGMVLLAEPGANVADFEFRTYRVGQNVSTNDFFISEPNHITGFSFIGYIIANSTTALSENKTQYAIITNTPGHRGSGLYLYTTNSMSGNLDIQPYAMGVLGIKLAITNTPVFDAAPIKMLVPDYGVTNYDFVAGTLSWTSPFDGYVVFVGAYRKADGFLLSDFTVLCDKTMPYATGNAQHLVVAYKKVSANETVACTSTERFGGTFFATATDLSAKNYTVGMASKSADTITFPMVADGKCMFGIAGFIWDASTVGKPNNKSVAYWKSSSTGRLTTFVAVDYVQVYGDDNISFPISPDYDHLEDIGGIWVEFD